MRVLILNQPFHPDVVATAQIAKDLADDLVARGHEVTAIASRSIYGKRGATLPRRETVDGIRIIRVGSNVFGKGTVVGRLLDFGAYYLMATAHGLFRKKFDVAVCLTTPPFIATVGLLLRALRGTRVVLWTMDVYPDVMVAHSMLREGSTLHRLLRWLHRRVLAGVDRTIVLGRCMKERLVEQGGDPGKIEVVPVWSASEAGADAPPEGEANPYRREWGVGDRTVVMYAGNFGLAHDVGTFLDAAERMKADDSVRFVFVGGGKRWGEVESRVRERGLSNCRLVDYQPRERLADLLAAADVHLVTMLPEWWGLVVPSKFYGVAMAGRPVVFVGPERSEIARVITETGGGAAIAPGDAEGLRRVLTEIRKDAGLRGDMGRAAAQGARTRSARATASGRIVQIIEALGPRQAQSPRPSAASEVPPANRAASGS